MALQNFNLSYEAEQEQEKGHCFSYHILLREELNQKIGILIKYFRTDFADEVNSFLLLWSSDRLQSPLRAASPIL